MKTLTIDSMRWLTNDQFREIYGIGQIAPGPNMLMVVVIGHQVAGFAGALAAFSGFFLPSSAISLVASRLWERFAASPWRLSVQRAFAPIVVGLMLAGTIAIARTAISGGRDEIAFGLAAVVFVILYFGKAKPAVLIFASGVCGYVFFR
jgi:chromate transporter